MIKLLRVWLALWSLNIRTLKWMAVVAVLFSSVSHAQNTRDPIAVKVFIGAMFEIGAVDGDKAGEFQYWYQRYFNDSQIVKVPGAAGPVYCNQAGVCGAVLGMGKVASSASMLAIMLSPEFNFSQSYFLLTGVAGIPPNVGTIGDVSWATWLVDYDLGHRWAPEEEPAVVPSFKPRAGYENIRSYALNPALLKRVFKLTQSVALKTSPSADKYRKRYSQKQARRLPRLLLGTHVTGDTFFHGPGLSQEAQFITQLYGADPYTMTEMEATAIIQVIDRLHGTGRVLSLRGAVNFDQGNSQESTLEHLDPSPGNTAGGFDITLQNIVAVGSVVADDISQNWGRWRNGVE